MIDIIFAIDYIATTSGGPRFLIEVFKKLAKNSYRIHVITGAVDNISIYAVNNMDIINLKIYKHNALPSEQPTNVIRFLYKASKLIKELIKEYTSPIVHLNSHFPNLLSYITKSDVPTICSIHHLEETTQFLSAVSKTAKIIIQDLLEINSPCSVIHVPSRYTRQEAERIRLIKSRNIVIIPPGIEVRKYIHLPRKVEDHLFIMIGRLEKRKHYDHAIAAFKIITKYRPDYKLIIIGDGSLKYKLIQLIKRYGLERNISLLGSVDEETKIKLLSRAEALIHLGYPEGFGIVILEALATGTPVITYNVPPINEIVRNGVTGILIERDNIVALTKTIMNFDHQNFDEATLKRVATKYDINKIAKRFETLYRSLAIRWQNEF